MKVCGDMEVHGGTEVRGGTEICEVMKILRRTTTCLDVNKLII